jgi:hypothetical protein
MNTANDGQANSGGAVQQHLQHAPQQQQQQHQTQQTPQQQQQQLANASHPQQHQHQQHGTQQPSHGSGYGGVAGSAPVSSSPDSQLWDDTQKWIKEVMRYLKYTTDQVCAS